MEIIYATDGPEPDRFADPGYQETMAKVDALLANPETGIPVERPARRTERITWDDVQAVYPDIPLAELQQQLGDYGATLNDLVFEVVTAGSWGRWSNERQKFERCAEPDFWPFSQGGILLIMSGSTREPFGMGRKTGKWFVDSEEFQTYAEAHELSERVKAAPPVGSGDPSDYEQMFDK